ncbi:hypothetical protein X739_01355 [Mesorhizobium sp. LNHC220B00]|nr:hypothetical protein X739_01355 [Mesorhizobium sp. LNHC220B00]
MPRHQFVQELEHTASHIADASRADLQVLLRRAADRKSTRLFPTRRSSDLDGLRQFSNDDFLTDKSREGSLLKGILSTRVGVFRLLCIFVAVVSLLAIAPWPYGYYQMLRVIVFFAGIYCGIFVRSTSGENQSLAWALYAAAVIFNPFLPVHLPREVWAVLNIAAAGLFGFAAYQSKS